MKILIVGQAYYREDNGQATFTVRLARGLQEAGHCVTALTPAQKEATAKERINGVQVHRFPAWHLPHNANITFCSRTWLEKMLQEIKPDIIHLQDHYFLSRSAWQASRAQAHLIPVVGTNHFLPQNLTANIPLPARFRARLEPVFWKHMLSLYNRLAAVTTPTQTAANILINQGLKVPVSAISCGVDTNRFKPNQEARKTMRLQLRINEESDLFLYVGRLDHEKGLREVVDAFADVNSAQAILVLAGRGSCLHELQKQVDDKGLAGRVLFPGFIAAEDLPRLYNAADCFVMAGFAELQSIVTLEAMASGLPILAANACALPELVRHQENGLLFSPHSATSLAQEWRTFFAIREKWPAMGQMSRKWAEEHNLTRSVALYATWYEEVLHGAGQNLTL